MPDSNVAIDMYVIYVCIHALTDIVTENIGV